MKKRKPDPIEFFQVADGWRIGGLERRFASVNIGIATMLDQMSLDGELYPFSAVRTDFPLDSDGDYIYKIVEWFPPLALKG